MHQLVNKDFDSIKMHGINVKRIYICSSDHRRDSAHAVHVTCILLSERRRHLCCVAWERGLEKKSLSKRSFATLSGHGQRMVRARSELSRKRHCTCWLSFNCPSEDFTPTQPLRRRSLTTKSPVRSHAASLGIVT